MSTQASTLYTALLAAMQATGPLTKNAQNPHLRNKYADLTAVLNTIEQPLWDNGLIVVQRFTHDQGGPILVTEIIHAASGERITSELPVVSKDPTDPQKLGAAITYMRRYSLISLLGLSAEEDDGHSASQPPSRGTQRQRYEDADYSVTNSMIGGAPKNTDPGPAPRPQPPAPRPQPQPRPDAPQGAPGGKPQRPEQDAPANWTTIWREAKAMGIPDRAALVRYLAPDNIDQMQPWQVLARLRETAAAGVA